ncbi:MAG: hypothetical protein ACI30N_06425, partial [Muribaculaceae bacterium]
RMSNSQLKVLHFDLESSPIHPLTCPRLPCLFAQAFELKRKISVSTRHAPSVLPFCKNLCNFALNPLAPRAVKVIKLTKTQI